MLRAGFLALAAAVMAATAHASVSVTIKNSCSESISLYDNSATTTMAAGASTTRTLANSYVGMFRNGADDEATLAEFSVDSDGTPWYDISIIPPGSTTCTSLSACQSETGVTGFNTAIQIAPQSNTDSTNCEVVTCMADGCDDAYQYPTDDDNTHTCPVGTSFVVTFCPGGSGSSSSSTTSTPTPTPTSTTATPTPTPTSTTATPTPTPTASASSSGSDSDDSGSSEVAGEAYDGSFSLSNSTSTTKSSASKDTDTGSAGVAEAADTDSATTAATSDDATAAATTDASGSDDGAVEISTQSSGGGGSTFGIVFASGIAVVGIAAGGFIYAVRQKKKQLDNETKSPGPETSREVSVLMATPGVVL